MDIEEDDSLTASALAFVPWLVILGNGWLVLRSYSSTLDINLNWRRPPVPSAPEDVLVLGFWMPWAFVATIFAFALAIAIVPRKRKTVFACVVLTVFVLVSASDYFLYRTLERQVLGM